VIHPQPDPTTGAAGGRILGILLAAGAGRRAGGPKALRLDTDGKSWLLRSIAVLRDGGCNPVIVVLGCQADRAREVIASSTFNGDPVITVVDAPDWEQGMGASLRPVGVMASGAGAPRRPAGCQS
jgi:CTP:molybdopterin cytidylyltransferase MocA